ncbi:MAG: L-rhamnose isomerase [Actinobacteria bacterium 13_1_40CM_2_65_8]|nr:MAG: L-rhamnose isomerase [Actinobacteria bacterium 13_1_40CM_4_65_12]OLD49489.1 MAG: L-rhamnose isomerase [Actinobacteria bacterium 13_1_40CM_2_65_8]
MTDQRVLERINHLRVETPSWGYGNSGTRFKVFGQPGAARTIEEKLADAGMVNRLTGICPTVALHIPWDRVDDWDALSQIAAGHGVKIGAINPNLFQDDEYMLGSLAHPSAAVRSRAIDHVLECIEIAHKVGSSIVSLWLADGTNYPGQDDLRSRARRMRDGLKQIYAALPPGIRLLVEYKFFEPGFYSTELPDWGTAYASCIDLGPQAEVLVDTGHHAPGVNIEQIVAQLLDRARLGGFHFNARKYADDDLIVGSSNPFELFLIFNELVAAEEDSNEKVASTARNVAYMIDQSHNIEPKLEAMVQSVMNIQTAHAKALIVDRARLREAQAEGDVLRANRVLVEAYETDVRPALAEARKQLGIDPDPVAALRRSGYVERVSRERGKAAAGSGYPGA